MEHKPLIFPNIDPVALSIGPLDIRWYALSYVAGILIGWWMLGRLNNAPARYDDKPLSQRAYDDIIVWAVIGIMLGGRLGYVLFYNAEFFLANPADILKIWQGGMSFHGGLIGVIVAMALMTRWHKLNFLRVMDLLACVAPIGIGLGRIANFVNAELYGRITVQPWGMIFPGTTNPRHPSQLYEAALEGLLLFIIMLLCFRFTGARNKPGTLGGIFLIGYGAARAFVEQFREPDAHIGFVIGEATMGQLLSYPMIALGLLIVVLAQRKSA